MQVTIIGTGNVATVLGKLMFSKGHTINQVYGRNLNAVQVLAIQTNATPIVDLAKLNSEADIYIIAVSDKSIESICQQVHFENKIVLHTAGSVSIDVLKNTSKNYGILYPIQSLRKAMDINTPIPFLIDGNDIDTRLAIDIFTKSFSKQVAFGDDDKSN